MRIRDLSADGRLISWYRTRRRRTKVSARRRPVVFATVAAALVLAGPLVAGVIPQLDQVARLTGVREQPPWSGGPFQPADVPYISVRPLMWYLATDEPVVPSAAVVSRKGHDVVFTVPIVNYPAGDTSTTPIEVHAQSVTIDRRYGRAVTISSGLTPCSTVVVDPPSTLEDGDEIRSYQSNNAEGLNIDYAVLFDGRSPAPTPPIEGGIAHEEGGIVTIAITYHGPRPEEAATYVYTSLTDSAQRLPFAENSEVRIPRAELHPNLPVGDVQILTSSGELLAQGHLEWHC